MNMYNAISNSDALAVIAYLVAGVLFILALRGLSSQETAKQIGRAHV